MEKSLLKQILHEYDEKRNKANLLAEKRKAELLAVNPRLSEMEKELANLSLQTTKAILISNESEKEKLLSDLKKKTNALIKEKSAFLKSLSKDSDFLNPQFECKMCKDTGYVLRDGVSKMCTCFKQRIYDIAYNKSNMGNLELENFSTFDSRIFSDKVNKEIYKSDISPRQNIKLIKEKVQSFIDNFDDPAEKNLLFTGNTGIRKNFSY